MIRMTLSAVQTISLRWQS